MLPGALRPTKSTSFSDAPTVNVHACCTLRFARCSSATFNVLHVHPDAYFHKVTSRVLAQVLHYRKDTLHFDLKILYFGTLLYHFNTQAT